MIMDRYIDWKLWEFFCTAKELDLVDWLVKSANFTLTKTLNKRNQPGYYLYRENKRNVPVLGVAHLDTVLEPKAGHFGQVWIDGKLNVFTHTHDDRTGAYLIFDVLPKLDIHIDWLFTTGEETGKSSAEVFVDNVLKDKDHKRWNWLVELDRQGVDVVCYQYEDASLRALLTKSGFTVGKGSNSDIGYMEDLGVKAINVGHGYYGAHTPRSWLIMPELEAQLNCLGDFYDTNVDAKLPHTKQERPIYSGFVQTTVTYSNNWECLCGSTFYGGGFTDCTRCKYTAAQYKSDRPKRDKLEATVRKVTGRAADSLYLPYELKKAIVKAAAAHNVRTVKKMADKLTDISNRQGVGILEESVVKFLADPNWNSWVPNQSAEQEADKERKEMKAKMLALFKKWFPTTQVDPEKPITRYLESRWLSTARAELAEMRTDQFDSVEEFFQFLKSGTLYKKPGGKAEEAPKEFPPEQADAILVQNLYESFDYWVTKTQVPSDVTEGELQEFIDNVIDWVMEHVSERQDIFYSILDTTPLFSDVVTRFGQLLSGDTPEHTPKTGGVSELPTVAVRDLAEVIYKTREIDVLVRAELEGVISELEVKVAKENRTHLTFTGLWILTFESVASLKSLLLRECSKLNKKLNQLTREELVSTLFSVMKPVFQEAR